MSNYWDLYCVTCDQIGDICTWNHGEEVLRQLIQALPAIAQLAPFKDLGGYQLGLTLDWASQVHDFQGHALIDFALVHSTHDVRPRSEYGYCLGDCGMQIHHTEDDQRDGVCLLPRGHQGDHDHERRPK